MILITIIYFFILLIAIRYTLWVLFGVNLLEIWNEIDAKLEDIILPPYLLKPEVTNMPLSSMPISAMPISAMPLSEMPLSEMPEMPEMPKTPLKPLMSVPLSSAP